MDNNQNRILGRILAVDETMSVAGAKVTQPCRDLVTAIQTETCIPGGGGDAMGALAGSGTLSGFLSGQVSEQNSRS